ncbi:unannotated protein [freshwater metagenome]|uniref:Unannotated protein n=1 Tax=freshwater metagenome TaxID=449393 RepID=A0A6J6B9G4_9ZZZZ|nr:hypothetical protein [Actinomycetota bacterium]
MSEQRRRPKQRRNSSGGQTDGSQNGSSSTNQPKGGGKAGGKGGSKSGNKGGRQNKVAPPAEFWRAAPEPPEPPDIRPAQDPTALLQSMGTAPLPGQASVSDHYMAAVIQRAAMLATALAASADLLEQGE